MAAVKFVTTVYIKLQSLHIKIAYNSSNSHYIDEGKKGEICNYNIQKEEFIYTVTTWGRK